MSSFKTVPPLGSTATFYDWFNSYNINARDKMNSIFISRPYAGDGITLAGNTTDGGYTFAIDGIINKSITFNGNIKFNGVVNLSNVELSNILVGITGNFISVGVTAGSLVRLTENGGLTLAKANNAESAESIGIAVSVDTTRTMVAVAGKIVGTTFSNYLSPGGFSLGCVYFLDPSNAGGITKTEPVALGTVSKPVLIGSSQHEAIILPYRGQYINDDGISGDATFNSAFYANVKSIGETLGDFKIGTGTILAGTNDKGSITSNSYNAYDGGFYFFPATSSTNRNNILGIVTEIVQFSSVDGNKIILKVNTNGSAIPSATTLNVDWASIGSNAGNVYLDDNGKPTLSISQLRLGIMSETNFVFDLIPPSTSVNVVSNDGTTLRQNILINGSLSLWQRGRGVTTPYGITTASSVSKQYLADKWIMWAGTTTGFTASRKDFTNTQIEVSGYPKYYVSLMKNSTPSTTPSYFYNVIDDVRTIANKSFVLSFYVKTDGPTGEFTVKSIQNITPVSGNTYINETTHATFSANLNWTRKSVLIQGPSANSGITSSYSLMGIGLHENGKTFNFAQFILEPGTESTEPQLVNPEEEYKLAAKYYQRSYQIDELSGTQYQPSEASDLILKGGRIVHSGRYPLDIVPFPIKMNKAPTLQFYSLSGSLGDGTVYTNGIWRNYRESNGFGVGDCARYYFTGMPDPLQSGFISETSFSMRFNLPWCPFDDICFHYVADADTTIN